MAVDPSPPAAPPLATTPDYPPTSWVLLSCPCCGDPHALDSASTHCVGCPGGRRHRICRQVSRWADTLGACVFSVAAAVMTVRAHAPLATWAFVLPLLLLLSIGSAVTDARKAGLLAARVEKLTETVLILATAAGFVVLVVSRVGA